MTDVKRSSPISFPAKPAATEDRLGWNVVLEYEGEGGGPWLVDLSHCQKWDLQDSIISEFHPFGLPVPDAPGKSIFLDGTLVNRMNQTQVSIWRLRGSPFEAEEGPGYTETTDGQILLALLGKNIFEITEKLTSLNFAERDRPIPCLVQGPFSHVPCQIVVLDRSGLDGALFLACSRGYAHDMVHALLGAGKEFGLSPAGENVFTKLLDQWSRESK